MKRIKGVGSDKAATLSAAFELARRVEFNKRWLSNSKIKSPKEIASIFIPLLKDEPKEKFLVVSLNSANKIIKYDIISEGILNSSLVHPREVFKTAIENLAASIILAHNHPSGNSEPSPDDISVTKKIYEAGKILDIKVVDHVIIAGDNYFSMAENKFI